MSKYSKRIEMFLLAALAERSHVNRMEGSKLEWYWAPMHYYRDYSNFDIIYDGGMTTYQNNGWCTEFRVDGGSWHSILGENNGTYTYRDSLGTLKWRTEITRPLGVNYLSISFYCENIGNEPRTIDFCCFADIMIQMNDFADVLWYGKDNDRRGLTMTDYITGATLTVLAKNGYLVDNVDTFWFGQWSGSHDRHNLETRTEGTLEGVDSAFSLGWKDKVIYGGETLKFSVLMGVGVELPDPPVVMVEETFKENYAPNEPVHLKVKIMDYNKDEKVTYYIDFNNGAFNKTETINGPAVDSLSKTLEYDFNMPQAVGKYLLNITAIDKSNLTSNVYLRYLLVNEKPRITVTPDSIRPEYFTGGVVEITGTLWDDLSAKVHYRFGTDYNFFVNETFECNSSTVPYRVVFNLREKKLQYGKHKLYVWAEDNFGIESNKLEFEFNYRELHVPKLEIMDPYDNVHTVNDYIMIKGKVYDQDYDETIEIWYKDPISEPTEPFQLASVTPELIPSNIQGVEFSVIFQIPRYYPIGTNLSYIFQARDSHGGFSRDAKYYFTVKKIPAPTEPPVPTTYPLPDNHLPSNSSVPEGYNAYNSNYTSYTKTNVTVSEGEEEYSTWTLTSSSIQIYAEVPPATPFPSETPVPPDPTPKPFIPGDGAAAQVAQPQNKKQEKKSNLIPIIVGAVAAVVAAAVIAAVVIWHEAAKKAKEFEFNEEDLEAYQDEMNDAAMTKENGMYNEDGNDDPFANEFDEEAPAEGVFPQN